MIKHVGASVRRRRGTVIGAVMAVAAVVLGFAQVKLLTPPSDSPVADAPSQHVAVSAGRGLIDLDVAPTTAPAAVRECLVRGFASRPAHVTVVYGLEQRTNHGTAPALVLRNSAGDLRLCDQLGGDFPATAPVPHATSTKPVVFLSTGRTMWDCTRSLRLRTLTQTSWLSVGADVDRIQVRYAVDGTPGPWFLTHVYGGYAHLQTWKDGALARGSRLTVQTRVVDAAGHVVRQRTLPVGPQRLTLCPAPGAAQIG